MASPDPDIASLAASIAVNAHLKRLDDAGRRARTAPATAGRLKKYLDQVDPTGAMSETERLAAAKFAMREDMARLSLIAVKAKKELAALQKEAAHAS